MRPTRQANDSGTMRRGGSEAGQILVLAALGLTVLIGSVGLAVDLGSLYFHKRYMQTAADAGALAGAFEKFRNNPGQVQPSASQEAADNGFTQGVDGVSIAVSNPPATGFFSQPSASVDPPSYVEVTINHDHPTYFMRILGWRTVAVSARAVAGAGANSRNCIYVLNPSVPEAFHVHDSVLNFDCGTMVNSVDPRALYVESASNVNAPINIAGGYDITSDSPVTPDPATGVPPVPDPLTSLEPPPYTPGTCDYTNYQLKSGNTDTIGPSTPGGTVVFCGGIHVESASNLTMLPGIYIMEGNQGRGSFVVESHSSVWGEDVMIYLTHNDAAVGYDGGFMGLWLHDSPVHLTAATEGPYAGILFFEDRTAPTPSPPVGGDNAGTTPPTEHFIESNEAGNPVYLEGALYLPYHHLRIHATPGTIGSPLAPYTIIIVDTLYIESISNVTIQGDYSGLPGGSPIKRVTLVE